MENETKPLGYPKPNKQAIAKAHLIKTQNQNNSTRDLLFKLEQQAKEENNQFLLKNINETQSLLVQLNLKLQLITKNM